MPRVPRLTEPQLATAALPSARLNVSASPEAFGAGFARPLAAVADLAQQERDKADAVALTDADAKAAKLQTQLELAAREKKGKDAMGLPETTMPEWQKGVASIEAELTPRLRVRFRELTTRRNTDLDRSLQHWMADQADAYDDATTEAAVATAEESAAANYNDPARVAAERQRIRAYTLSKAARKGLDGDPAALMVSTADSSLHKKVLGAMLTDGRYREAMAYYAANGDAMLSADRAAAGKAVEEAGLRVRSVEASDAILGKGGTMMAALAEVGKIEDPLLRDEVRTRVKQGFADREAAKAADEKAALDSAVDAVTRAGSVDAISPQAWAGFDKETRGKLRALAARGEWYQDDKRWYEFTRLPADKVAAMNLYAEVRPYVDDEHWDAALRLQRDAQAARQGDPDARAKLANQLTFQQRVETTLRSNGIIKAGTLSDDQRAEWARFESEADRRISAAQVEKGSALSGDEQQAIMDGILLEQVRVPGWASEGEPRPLFKVPYEKRQNTVILREDVPPAEVELIREWSVRVQGREPTEQEVVAAYRRKLGI